MPIITEAYIHRVIGIADTKYDALIITPGALYVPSVAKEE